MVSTASSHHMIVNNRINRKIADFYVKKKKRKSCGMQLDFFYVYTRPNPKRKSKGATPMAFMKNYGYSEHSLFLY